MQSLSRRVPMVVAALVLLAMPKTLPAQEQRADSLRARVRHIEARLDSLERGACLVRPPGAAPAPTGSASVDSLAMTVWRLEERLARLAARQCAQAPAKADSVVDDLAALRAAAAAAAAGAAETDTTQAGPVQFISQQRSGAALNPEISATGDVRLVARDPGPQRDNAVAREVELSFQSALDPYSHTKIFLTFSEDEIGVEEGYVYWTGLPGRLRLDVGKIRQQVGDLNRWHLHALPETDYPLVYQRFLGDEGLEGVGLSLYTLLPVSIAGGSHEVWLQGTSASSEPLFGSSGQPTVLGRLQNFWQLDRSTYFQIGFTGVGGNNGDLDLRSRLLGTDLRLTWRPPNAGTRREVTLRAEGYRLHAAEGDVATNRYGAFVDVQVRASRRWVLGVRYDWVESPRGPLERDWQIVPALTWWQSEFVFLRLEGRHARLGGESGNQLLAQVVWAMGPHKHETY